MDELKEIILPVNIVFNGTVTVKATSDEEAQTLIQEHIFTRLGNVKSDNDNITDWDIDLYGECELS